MNNKIRPFYFYFRRYEVIYHNRNGEMANFEIFFFQRSTLFYSYITSLLSKRFDSVFYYVKE